MQQLTFVWTILCCLFAGPLAGQAFSGQVIDRETGLSVPGASLYLIGNEKGMVADEDGKFAFSEKLTFPDRLVATMLDYERDTFTVNSAAPFTVSLRGLDKDPVVITGSFRPIRVSQSPVKVEVLNRQFLRQIPSNNVMEVIDYVNGVNRQIGCGVCGTSDIHINGMEGPYTLVLIDGMPIMSALGSVYGLDGIPNSLIERIEIVKGAGSTLYGSDAVGGTVNIITRDPDQAPRAFVSAWGTSHLERNLDFSVASRVGKAKMIASGNHYGLGNRIDANGDNFTDVPLAQRVSLFNKWEIDRPNHKAAQFAAKGYYEDRFGGTLQWQPENRGSDQVYGESILTQRVELLGNYDLPGREHINLKGSFSHHDQDSYYGDTPYLALQQTGFFNAVWYKNRGNHNFFAGTAVRYQRYNDNTPATEDIDLKVVPGIFVENEWEARSNLTLLGGLRYDRDRDHGAIWSPRFNLRWKPGTFSTFRLTTGTGFRNVNLFTEEHAALTGARTVLITEALDPERSFNVGANYNKVFNIGESAATLDMDLFYTYFTNKIIPDYDQDPNLIVYRNLPGHSIIRGAAARLSHTFRVPFSYDVGATFMDVFQMDELGSREQQEFAPVFTGVFSASYHIKSWRTRIDYTARVVGPMALPTFDPAFARPETSEWFTEQNITLNTELGRGFALLAGVRNLFNYTQSSPLIDPGNPFSDSFDTAYAYGPLQGRRAVLGLQWQLEPRKN